MLASEQIRLWLGVFLFSLLPHVIGVDDSTILWLHRLDDLGVVGAHVLHEVTVHAQRHHLVDLLRFSSSESKLLSFVTTILAHEFIRSQNEEAINDAIIPLEARAILGR